MDSASLLTKQVKEDCIQFTFFLQCGKSQGKSIKQHLALQLVSFAMLKQVACQQSEFDCLSGSHRKQPVSCAAAVSYQFVSSVFNLLECLNQRRFIQPLGLLSANTSSPFEETFGNLSAVLHKCNTERINDKAAMTPHNAR